MTLLLENETQTLEAPASAALPLAEASTNFKVSWAFGPDGSFQGARWTF